ncbi:TolC family protein [uncultured Duncaniella sp.]|uniref:TolC family protein n=1 Tax=uncultured Duncaniella sp. TaxID=2768039 RepID=UPI0025CE8831|nr:TolC family protein [uncultured Duncaniella sp.]
MKFIQQLMLLGSLAVAMTAGAAEEAVKTITLEEAILTARANSVDAAVALNELRTAYWTYRTYRADLLPEVNFNATIPSYHKSYSPYQLDDGSYTFVRNNYMQMSGEVSIDQNIWLTGGTLSLNTSLDFLKQLENPRYNRFMSVPIALTLSQPIFGVNHTKWNRRIEPVRYEESKAAFISATETVALTAINYYFSLLLAKENVEIASQNLANAEKLYEVAKAKREMGQISKNDLLQLELNLLNARSNFTDCEISYKSNMFQLRAFLNIQEDVTLEPVVPEKIPYTMVSYNDVLEKAHAYNSFSKNIRRRQLEADYAVAQAKGNQREITLFAQIGYTGTADKFGPAYDTLKDNQVVEIGFKVPILDWGKRRGKVKVSESNRDVVKSRLRKEQMDFDQNIFILVERFNNQQRQLDIALRADTIAQRRYDTNVETFLIGKISTLDLNDSQTSKDQSRQDYINQLYYYWNYYYQLRSVALWDFVTNKGIDADIEAILRQ